MAVGNPAMAPGDDHGCTRVSRIFQTDGPSPRTDPVVSPPVGGPGEVRASGGAGKEEAAGLTWFWDETLTDLRVKITLTEWKSWSY